MTNRDRVRAVVDSAWFTRVVVGVIVINAICLGLETSPSLMSDYGTLIHGIDVAAVVFFVVEISARLFAYRLDFFRDPWNWFDLIVVGFALVPSTESFAVLRALRIMRALRLISQVPSMRRVVGALLGAIPGLLSILALLLLVLYSSAVVGVQLFREGAPEDFGNLSSSLFTLFEVMTLEGWQDIADPVMDVYPASWIFFVGYIVVTAYIVLNLLLAVLVSTMEVQLSAERWKEDQDLEAAQHNLVMAELRAVRSELAELRAATPGAANGADPASPTNGSATNGTAAEPPAAELRQPPLPARNRKRRRATRRRS
ncbi:ion transporter [Actinoalloteichus hymeniacidonis]|uniref:Ion transport protein n=1 Tax=Actinoalloteichus hymeniacidonis TaxID=340345 RepID=A0AAC9N094_9PSEU|nr:ion transporter [Actinoalloteichus hymeniacidonis]AOS65175.1 Ion transport protein [Actinoalloteichus hymeniacidonis]MBB5906745.1 voltage-gated sodium channel [Actinoalloteichus hymeniacidonis]